MTPRSLTLEVFDDLDPIRAVGVLLAQHDGKAFISDQAIAAFEALGDVAVLVTYEPERQGYTLELRSER